MSEISQSKLKEDIKEILKNADLSSLSGKKVRKQLEENYDTDLTERKKEIDEIVMEVLDEMKNGGDESEANSSSSEDIEDAEPVVKKKKIATKKDKDSDDDAELAKQLQEDENSGRRPRRSTAAAAKPQKKKIKDPSKKKPPRLAYLSPTLSAILGTDHMARADVVKRMWQIIKERNLQDPKAKQFMICDDELFTVFGKKRIRTFGMMKYLSNHIFHSEEDFHNTTC